MILGRGDSEDGRQVLLIGLTDENVKALTAGKPIRMQQETHGPGVPDGWIVLIAHAKDDQTLANALLATEAGKNAEVHHEPKLGDYKKGP